MADPVRALHARHPGVFAVQADDLVPALKNFEPIVFEFKDGDAGRPKFQREPDWKPNETIVLDEWSDKKLASGEELVQMKVAVP